MNDTVMLLLIYSYFVSVLVLDLKFIGELRKKDRKQWRWYRGAVLTAYLFTGTVWVERGGLPAVYVLPPCLIAAGVSIYVHFVRNRDEKINRDSNYKHYY